MTINTAILATSHPIEELFHIVRALASSQARSDCETEGGAIALLRADRHQAVPRVRYARFLNEDSNEVFPLFLYAHDEIEAEIHHRLKHDARGRQKHEATRAKFHLALNLANRAKTSPNHVQLTSEKTATSRLDTANAD